MDSNGRADWVTTKNDAIWNSGTESSPIKTSYDPCPEGWRVPTCEELTVLKDNYSTLTSTGRWYSGEYTYIEGCPRIFFPATGLRYSYDGSVKNRYRTGGYWSSKPGAWGAYALYYDSAYTGRIMDAGMARADGHPVRCVQE